MNNPNPFLPQGAFLEQKNKARTRLKIAVYFSISLSVMVLMVLLIQGCKKPNDTTDTSGTTAMETNMSMPQLPTNPPDMGSSNMAMTPPPETNPPPMATPPPAPPPVAPPVGTTQDYVIVKGDTLDSIHKKFNVSVKAIMDANSGLDPKKLKIGQKLHIPEGTAAPTMSAPVTSATVDVATGTAQTYKVKSGDTLDGIHRKFKVSIKAIQSANNMTTTSIKVGQVLKIPGSAAPAPAPAPTESLPPPSLSAPTSAPAPTTLPPPTASHAPRS